MPRHKLTLEDRRKAAAATNARSKAEGWRQQKEASKASLASPKRHKLTRSQRQWGAKVKYDLYGFTGHKLTQADRRRGGLATAAKRRRMREGRPESGIAGIEVATLNGWADEGRAMVECTELVTTRCAEGSHAQCSGAAPPATIPCDCLCHRAAALPPEPLGPVDDVVVMGGQVYVGEVKTQPAERGSDSPKGADPSPDPFTLSALRRFRLGPLSPLALTRSQRAHVDLMLAGGWVEKTAESLVRLTAKGEAALANEEASNG